MKKSTRIFLVLSFFALSLGVKAYDTGPPEKVSKNEILDKDEVNAAGLQTEIFTVYAKNEVEPLILISVSQERSFETKSYLESKNLKFPEVSMLKSDAAIPIRAQASYSYINNKTLKLPEHIYLHNFAVDRYWC